MCPYLLTYNALVGIKFSWLVHHLARVDPEGVVRTNDYNGTTFDFEVSETLFRARSIKSDTTDFAPQPLLHLLGPIIHQRSRRQYQRLPNCQRLARQQGQQHCERLRSLPHPHTIRKYCAFSATFALNLLGTQQTLNDESHAVLLVGPQPFGQVAVQARRREYCTRVPSMAIFRHKCQRSEVLSWPDFEQQMSKCGGCAHVCVAVAIQLCLCTSLFFYFLV